MNNNNPSQPAGDNIGFIGLGVMGEPICKHLVVKSGRQVFVNDQDGAPMKRLEELGAKRIESSGMAEQVSTIFLSLPSGEVVREVLFGDEGIINHLRAGQTVVDLSTSPVDITREVAQALRERGVHFADSPVMRTRSAAEAGTLAVPVGASSEIFAEIEPLIAHFASDIRHAGDIGAGQIVKILNNMVLYETVLALSEAHAIGRRAGIDPEVLFDAFASGSADSFALANHGRKAILPQNFPEKAFPVSYARKDISYAVQLAEQVGVDACGARNLIETLDQAIAAGHGDKYAPAISLLFEDDQPFGNTQ
ncbi:NAD(P)-dependent oxidoreductase [Salinisphaera aquimarina]|uniref:NAD(P)-dependent oxidoreductase n=1 Tax=Salinisphaera aquimarina TaxID=2094031 RepID=A0ABV7ELH7_9GAMM